MPPESALMRKLRGDGADWTLIAALLARLDYRAACLIWQGGGGKGPKPKPMEIPGASKNGKPARSREVRGEDAAQRLRNLGLIPAAAGERPPSPEQLRREAEDMFLAREQRLATES